MSHCIIRPIQLPNLSDVARSVTDRAGANRCSSSRRVGARQSPLPSEAVQHPTDLDDRVAKLEIQSVATTSPWLACTTEPPWAAGPEFTGQVGPLAASPPTTVGSWVPTLSAWTRVHATAPTGSLRTIHYRWSPRAFGSRRRPNRLCRVPLAGRYPGRRCRRL